MSPHLISHLLSLSSLISLISLSSPYSLALSYQLVLVHLGGLDQCLKVCADAVHAEAVVAIQCDHISVFDDVLAAADRALELEGAKERTSEQWKG